MTELREAAEMALDALDYEAEGKPDSIWKAERDALRQALADEAMAHVWEQKPVAWANSSDLENFDMRVRTNRDHYHTVPLYTAPSKQEYQYEVVAEHVNGTYTTKRIPKREWVGLSDEEIAEGQAGSWVDKQAFESAVWWAEKKLKEKNV